MFEFKFGILWTTITSIITIVLLFGGDLSEGAWIAVPLLLIFEIIGITFIVRGTIKLIRDKKTSNHGEECFAKVTRVYASGASVNDCPELKADFIVYVPSEFQVMNISEIIGFAPAKYVEGQCVKCKFYEGDINIIEEVSVASIPFNIQEKLGLEEDVIIVNGSRYQKID